MSLQVKRGLSTNRNTITPKIDELIHTTDTKKLYIGDGSTIGGVELTASFANTASYVAATISASHASTSSYVNNLTQSVNLLGNINQTGNFNVTGDIFVSGAITASTLYVENITSSNQYLTGSTIFGDDVTTDVHQFTGSVNITGSLFATSSILLASYIDGGSF